MAGVAGFEPTNDGVRVRGNGAKIDQKHAKIIKKCPFSAYSLPFTPQSLPNLLPNLSFSRLLCVDHEQEVLIAVFAKKPQNCVLKN